MFALFIITLCFPFFIFVFAENAYVLFLSVWTAGIDEANLLGDRERSEQFLRKFFAILSNSPPVCPYVPHFLNFCLIKRIFQMCNWEFSPFCLALGRGLCFALERAREEEMGGKDAERPIWQGRGGEKERECAGKRSCRHAGMHSIGLPSLTLLSAFSFPLSFTPVLTFTYQLVTIMNFIAIFYSRFFTCLKISLCEFRHETETLEMTRGV